MQKKKNKNMKKKNKKKKWKLRICLFVKQTRLMENNDCWQT